MKPYPYGWQREKRINKNDFLLLRFELFFVFMFLYLLFSVKNRQKNGKCLEKTKTIEIYVETMDRFHCFRQFVKLTVDNLLFFMISSHPQPPSPHHMFCRTLGFESNEKCDRKRTKLPIYNMNMSRSNILI